ncbi:MAG: PLP-dependent aminotransferase family protein [Oscillospiraceae bacterium]|nr:PLP-dependent aminotransferase family protein [Oscillospiraceae bacterium]
MQYTISDNMSGVQGSIIRELFKLAKDPNMIAFGGGNPSPETFPVDEIAEITAQVLRDDPVSVLQYGLSEGYSPLRETMKKHLSRVEGIDFENNELLIVSGGQQAADLATKVLVNRGDVILTEEPAFVGCLNTFRTYGAKLVGIPVESDGINIEKLEEALKTEKNIRFLYTIPSFQNPTGFTMSAEKRQQVYDLCKQYGVMIFEDNPYSELRFAGDAQKPIKALDDEGIVIYSGSFSKVMAPAFRLGFVVFNKELTGRMTVAKQTTDVHSTVLFQYIVNEYMNKYDYNAHIDATRDIYRRKCNLMLDEIEKKMHPAVKFNRPEGGLFVMAFLPEGVDSYPFVQEGIKRGVYCVPGVAFAVDASKPNNGFRMNYSTPTDEQIIKGVDILGKLSYEWLEK